MTHIKNTTNGLHFFSSNNHYTLSLFAHTIKPQTEMVELLTWFPLSSTGKYEEKIVSCDELITILTNFDKMTNGEWDNYYRNLHLTV